MVRQGVAGFPALFTNRTRPFRAPSFSSGVSINWAASRIAPPDMMVNRMGGEGAVRQTYFRADVVRATPVPAVVRQAVIDDKVRWSAQFVAHHPLPVREPPGHGHAGPVALDIAGDHVAQPSAPHRGQAVSATAGQWHGENRCGRTVAWSTFSVSLRASFADRVGHEWLLTIRQRLSLGRRERSRLRGSADPGRGRRCSAGW